MRNADLGGADLSYANLSAANLSYANLRGADLNWADLEGTDLEGAKGLPKNIRDAYRVQFLRQEKEKGKENANNYRRSDNNMAAD